MQPPLPHAREEVAVTLGCGNQLRCVTEVNPP